MPLDTRYIDDKNVVLVYRLPWQEVVTDLHDVVSLVTCMYTLAVAGCCPSLAYSRVNLLVNWSAVCLMLWSGIQVKNVSAGYASLNYREVGYEADDLIKVEMALNGA